MDILVRLFVKLLDYAYGKKPKPVDYERDPLTEEILKQADEEAQAKKRQQIVEAFQSTAAAVQGAIDYADIQWHLFSRAVETPVQFTFYCDRSIAKVIEKSRFTNPQELATFRRMVRRHVANSTLLGG